MHTPAQLMSGLLGYLIEQAKDIHLAAFTHSKTTELKKTFADFGALPWDDFNGDTEADTPRQRV